MECLSGVHGQKGTVSRVFGVIQLYGIYALGICGFVLFIACNRTCLPSKSLLLNKACNMTIIHCYR